MMKTTFRAEVFETNSSSMHALTLPLTKEKGIAGLDKLRYKIKLTTSNTFDFTTMGGGDLYTIREKLTYVWCAICQHMEMGNDWAYTAEVRIKEWLPRCTFVPPEYDDDEEEGFYINHQSSDVEFVKMMMFDKDLFEEAILYGTIHLWTDCSEIDRSGYSRVIKGDGSDDEDDD
ncbi:MAG: hypothetical protein FWD81_04935 [Methanomassiliicoccaceae archaeon]|nr:hypothetical protein [Methanomassiliicoccaceae archaeon]